jgi:hypothetical protein
MGVWGIKSACRYQEPIHENRGQGTEEIKQKAQIVKGQLYSVQYKGIIGAPDKVRCNTCEETRPLRLDFQRDKVKIHHVITSMQDCWS